MKVLILLILLMLIEAGEVRGKEAGSEFGWPRSLEWLNYFQVDNEGRVVLYERAKERASTLGGPLRDYLLTLFEMFNLERRVREKWKEPLSYLSTGDMMLGIYYRDQKRRWYIHRKGSYGVLEDYQAGVHALVNSLRSGIISLRYIMGAEEDLVRNYAFKLHVGLFAGISSGWNPMPDAQKQVQNLSAEESLRYAFRVAQQGLRESILKHYLESLVIERIEFINFFKHFYENVCLINEEGVAFEGDDRLLGIGGIPDIIKAGSGTLFYQPVTSVLSQIYDLLFEVNYRDLVMLCHQMQIQAMQLNKLFTLAELNLLMLSAQYNLLLNQEK